MGQTEVQAHAQPLEDPRGKERDVSEKGQSSPGRRGRHQSRAPGFKSHFPPALAGGLGKPVAQPSAGLNPGGDSSPGT